MSAYVVIRENDVTYERLDGEVIAVNLLTGRYYSMTGTAADCWSAVSLTGSVDASMDVLTNTYGSAPGMKGDLEEFVSTCIAAGLIEQMTGEPKQEGAVVLPSDFDRREWLPPRLDEYEDLQDLILVDPVHDTSALGWPHIEDEGS